MNSLSNAFQSAIPIVPQNPICPQSLQIEIPKKKFSDWSDQNHADSYRCMQRIAQIWKKEKMTDQYLIYGKVDSNFFNWEMVPYEKCATFIGRALQQIQVLWRIVFGGKEIAQKEREIQEKKYRQLLTKQEEKNRPLDFSHKGFDSFCRDDVIQKQIVIEGNRVNVLFNYAPIGFGGEKLHFLVVPKQHREAFTDVTESEYSESLRLTKKLVDHFTATRKTVKNVYLLNKTGIDAGQTLPHWHLHAIFSTNSTQDFWGKITVLKNILFGSTPMKKEALATRVDALKKELSSIQSH